MTPVLQAGGIIKRFGPIEVLHGVDFDLTAGQIHALIGENGAEDITHYPYGPGFNIIG